MFKIKDYILTPIDIYRGVLHLIKNAGLKDIIGLAVLAGLFVFFRNYLEWQTDSSLFMIFWIALFFWNLDSRISIAGALVCLISCPILLILFEKDILLLGEEYAEQSAVWAYYFLVIGVTKQIWEFRKESAEEKEEPETEEKAIRNVRLEPEQSPAPVAQETSGEKAKTIDEIVEETQRRPKQADRRIQQKTSVGRQRIIMDIISPKKR